MNWKSKFEEFVEQGKLARFAFSLNEAKASHFQTKRNLNAIDFAIKDNNMALATTLLWNESAFPIMMTKLNLAGYTVLSAEGHHQTQYFTDAPK
jgi:hypothetical protein